jgi:hypothetical protein
MPDVYASIESADEAVRERHAQERRAADTASASLIGRRT